MAKKFFVTALTAASLIALSIFLPGCSGATVSNTANTSAANQSARASNANNSSNANIAPNAAPSIAPNVAPANGNAVSTTNNVNSATVNANRQSVPPAKEPTPQIGSGANDLLLFTQLRNALGADRELQTYVVIEVKEGSVTLSGKAASAEKKAQAEQLIKAVNGVKSVKNNINVSK